jgi:hypothetical protein
MTATTLPTIIESISRPSCNSDFLSKLHEVLEKAEKTERTDVVSWMPSGRSFRVHQKEEFIETMLHHFNMNISNFKAFQRVLRGWGFQTFPKGTGPGSSYHPLFVKGKPELCDFMRRIVGKANEMKRRPPSTTLRGSSCSATVIKSYQVSADEMKYLDRFQSKAQNILQVRPSERGLPLSKVVGRNMAPTIQNLTFTSSFENWVLNRAQKASSSSRIQLDLRTSKVDARGRGRIETKKADEA